MADFFSNDFSKEKWKKAALKNAFVLMGKQRFEHAVAFFLLGEAFEDALQVFANIKYGEQSPARIDKLHSAPYATSASALSGRIILCSI